MELEQQFLIMGVMGGEQVLRRMLIIDKHDAGAPVMAGIWNGTNGDTEVLKKYRRAMIADLTDEPPWIVKEPWHRLQPEIKASICGAMKTHAQEICSHMHLGEAVQ